MSQMELSRFIDSWITNSKERDAYTTTRNYDVILKLLKNLEWVYPFNDCRVANSN